ncbi:hypothetical protein AVEN_241804-1 [Araneus ventricosus]|uniref:Uncharacterized protein n=1 Tax=Araneus ventricosus TaxID=182803 RepID=A0A4Y2PSI5_ARAVE|nr:hypothetical protein AVEN_241804-1 [Araneus ventricosus]
MMKIQIAFTNLPIEDIVDGWLCIMEDSPENEKLHRFYDYFVNQWMENSVITIDMWNCHKKLHITNNVVEPINEQAAPKNEEFSKKFKRRSRI